MWKPIKTITHQKNNKSHKGQLTNHLKRVADLWLEFETILGQLCICLQLIRGNLWSQKNPKSAYFSFLVKMETIIFGKKRTLHSKKKKNSQRWSMLVLGLLSCFWTCTSRKLSKEPWTFWHINKISSKLMDTFNEKTFHWSNGGKRRRSYSLLM